MIYGEQLEDLESTTWGTYGTQIHLFIEWNLKDSWNSTNGIYEMELRGFLECSLSDV